MEANEKRGEKGEERREQNAKEGRGARSREEKTTGV